MTTNVLKSSSISQILARRVIGGARKLVAGIFAAGCVCGLAPQAAHADGVNFAGERIRVIVPFNEGGSGDIYTRGFAPYLQKYLPGQPSLIVQNIPGGSGGIPGSNRFQREAKPDGLMIYSGSVSNTFNYALKAKGVEYDLVNFEPIILSSLGAMVYISSDLGVSGPDEIGKLAGKELVYAGQSPTSADLRQMFMFDQLGLNVKLVWGLSTSKARLAFQRGEVNINNDSYGAYIQQVKKMREEGKAVVLFSFGVLDDNDNFIRDPHFPNVPHFLELYEKVHGKKMSGTPLEVWEALYHLSVSASKYFELPVGTPKPIVDAYQEAALKMLKDPEFQVIRKDMFGDYGHYTGARAKAILKKASSLSPEALNWIKDFLKTKHNVELDL